MEAGLSDLGNRLHPELKLCAATRLRGLDCCSFAPRYLRSLDLSLNYISSHCSKTAIDVNSTFDSGGHPEARLRGDPAESQCLLCLLRATFNFPRLTLPSLTALRAQ